MRFWLKFVDSFAFALPSLLLTLRLARPDAKPRALALWLLAPVHLAGGRRGRGIAGRAAKRVDVPAHGRERDALHDHDPDAGRSHPRGAHRRAARRRAAPSGADRRAGRRGRGGGRGASSTRRPAPTIRRCSWRPGIRSRRSSAWASARWPAGAFSPGDAAPERYFLISGSRIAFSWSMLSSPP